MQIANGHILLRMQSHVIGFDSFLREEIYLIELRLSKSNMSIALTLISSDALLSGSEIVFVCIYRSGSIDDCQ